MDVHSLDAFSKLYISTQAQKEADKRVNQMCELLDIECPLFVDIFNNAYLAQAYMLGLLHGGINEYHRELKANLLEAGIRIDDFIENPLIPSKD